MARTGGRLIKQAAVRVAPDVDRWAGQQGTVVEFNAGEVGVALVKGRPLIWFRPTELIKIPG
jgi:hypothetical protein